MTDADPPQNPKPRGRRRAPARASAADVTAPEAAEPAAATAADADAGITEAASEHDSAPDAAAQSAATAGAEEEAPEVAPAAAAAAGGAAAEASGSAEAPAEVEPAPVAAAAAVPAAQAADGGSGATGGRPPTRRGSRWRSIAVATMLIVAWVLTPISVAGIWLRNQIFDENTYVDTVAPLSSDPAVQNAVANYITFQIFSHLDVQAQAEKILPSALDPLAAPLAAAVQSFTAGKVHDVVTSDQFSTLWTTANRLAHQHVINFLLGRQGSVGVSGGKLVIDTRPMLDLVVQKLQASGVSFVSQLPLDKLNTNLEIADASGLQKAQDQLRLLQGVTIMLPFLTLALYAGAVALARDRRRALLLVGAGAAVGCLVLGVALALARGLYLDAVTGPHLPQDAAAAIFDTVVRFLRDSNRALFAVALLLMVGAFLTGPSRSAVSVRRGAQRLLDAVRGRGEARRWNTGSLGAWVGEHRGLLRVAVVVVAAIILMVWDRPTALVVLVIALGALLAIGVLEVLAGPRTEAPSAPTA